MTPIRLKSSLKMNVNLFRTLILPLYRLSFNLNCESQSNKKLLIKEIQKKFKKFISVPMSMPDKLVQLILGDL